ncbi:hypothetical protein [Mucilaginibacter lappiensis]|uniref:Uncharacterized protein n=2 Tax=Mucilaginibacter lappiensis TaxID=354630 RepID=A0A841JV93_9SPHI|nr:hypothetical protein [Mucilaginibacter lappiensis]MBB6131731.1 hypothetical protein [Mucilaginibacter lappiensis]
MKLAELKSEFHHLIDQIDDSEMLSQFYDVITQSLQPKNSGWQALTTQQQDILTAYEESEDESDLISLSALKSKYKECDHPCHLEL